MKTINFKHSIIFFNFCILISLFYLNEPIILCLFLILIVEFLMEPDNIKGKSFKITWL